MIEQKEQFFTVRGTIFSKRSNMLHNIRQLHNIKILNNFYIFFHLLRINTLKSQCHFSISVN